MNVDHIKPLHKRWDLRLNPRNLQTLCASCNWGKGATEKDWRKGKRRWRRAGAWKKRSRRNGQKGSLSPDETVDRKRLKRQGP